jgi:cytidylate kinase
MSHEVLYDLMTASYAMSNEGLPPLEKLFAAQTSIFRRIAASDESCVIVGRCADYILYNDPNCFRIFIHATPTARIQRLTARFHISESAAKAQMEATDQARARHYKHFTGREYGSQQYYHLAVDSGQVGIDGAVELIMESIRLWCGVRGTDPLSILHHE